MGLDFRHALGPYPPREAPPGPVQYSVLHVTYVVVIMDVTNCYEVRRSKSQHVTKCYITLLQTVILLEVTNCYEVENNKFKHMLPSVTLHCYMLSE